MRKGLMVYILKPVDFPDCSNKGISSKVSKAVLTGEGIPKIFEPTEDAPELVLVRRMIGGEVYLHCEPPYPVPEGCVGWMAGGNFVETSDSRFPNRYPISVHDRMETYEHYLILTT